MFFQKKIVMEITVEFLKEYMDNEPIGVGFQGEVYSLGTFHVVKKFKRTKYGKDLTEDIQREFNIGKRAGEVGVGVRHEGLVCDQEYCYLVMEKIVPVEVKQRDVPEIIRLFEKAIRHKIVNVDGGFGRNQKNHLVLYDYGVSEIAPDTKTARDMYQDYFYFTKQFLGIDGIYQHFFPSPKTPSPSKQSLSTILKKKLRSIPKHLFPILFLLFLDKIKPVSQEDTFVLHYPQKTRTMRLKDIQDKNGRKIFHSMISNERPTKITISQLGIYEEPFLSLMKKFVHSSPHVLNQIHSKKISF